MTLKFSEPKIKLLDKEEKLEIISDDTTDYRWGVNPTNRTIKQLFQYGVINLDKPPRPTSHEVVSYVKRILNITKAGHSGTLDPLVTGVLPIALNKATRILDTLLLAGKEYITNMQLHTDVEESRLRAVIKEFEGEIYQRPPLRASVKRVLRKRTIYEIDILETKERDVLFRVKCQAGTYVRKLCLHPSTQIITKEGLRIISEFYAKPCSVLSFNDGKVIEATPSAVQKLTAPQQLIKITMETGVSFIATPDHEMLRSTPDGYIMTEIRELKEGDYLVKSLTFSLPKVELSISDLLSDEVFIAQPEIIREVIKIFTEKNESLEKLKETLDTDNGSIDSENPQIKLKHLKQTDKYNKLKKKIYRFKFPKSKNTIEFRGVENIFYLLGLIIANFDYEDSKKNVSIIKFKHKNKSVIDKFIETYTKTFPNLKLDVQLLNDNLWEITAQNPLLVSIIDSLGINNQKGLNDAILLALEDRLIASYVKGFFDANGKVYCNTNTGHNRTQIIISISNIYEALLLHKLLLILRVENKIISEDTNEESSITNRFYKIVIDEIGAQKRLVKALKFNHFNHDKDLLLEKISQISSDNYEYGDKFHIALHYNSLLLKNNSKLKEFFEHNGVSIDQNKPLTRKTYEEIASKLDLPPLDDFIIERIIKIEVVKGCDYVYDMTIPITHNFLIETGYVSSNCHDIGQALGCGAHMKELRRTQSGPFTEDTFLSTLQDLYDAYAWYKEENDDTPLRNIILPMEYAVKHLPKMFVKDSAVDALCHGAPLARPGISKYSLKFKAGDILAIFTLKHELIGLAEAQVNATDIKEMKRGIIAKLKRVIMPPGTYPIRKIEQA